MLLPELMSQQSLLFLFLSTGNVTGVSTVVTSDTVVAVRSKYGRGGVKKRRRN